MTRTTVLSSAVKMEFSDCSRSATLPRAKARSVVPLLISGPSDSDALERARPTHVPLRLFTLRASKRDMQRRPNGSTTSLEIASVVAALWVGLENRDRKVWLVRREESKG
ncbi:unnamed protein product [Mortierella alpina]